jgi:SAM-dependent methyltransferase
LPLEPQTYDAIISVCHAHWVEDLPGFLIQLRHALKPDGVLVMALFGGETLTELRHVITQIELEKLGGISPRISPFATLLDMASLMQRAGYHLPVTDHDTWQVTYKDVHALVRDLRGMGQTNAVQAQSKNILPKDFWPEVDRAYRDQFGLPDGRLPVTVEVLFATGWAFDATQPQPLKRGSGVVSLTSILEK